MNKQVNDQEFDLRVKIAKFNGHEENIINLKTNSKTKMIKDNNL